MTVFTKTYEAPPYNLKEILRYSGCLKKTKEIDKLISDCIAECEKIFSYRVCYCILPVVEKGIGLDLGFIATNSNDLKKNLQDCHEIVLFGATVGIEIDRLIAKYGHKAPSRAVIFQAIGAERIESLCDAFCEDIKKIYEKEGFFTRPRFSAGYGDFQLDAQKNIFSHLDCFRKIGLSLNDSLLMSPTKSVTAIIGISKKHINCQQGCVKCDKIDCEFRRSK